MTTEVDQEEVTTQEDESAFEAGFAEARGDESPAEPTPVEPTEPEAQQAEEAPATNPDDELFLDNLTKADVKKLLAQASHVETLQNQLQKAHGRLGELNMRVQQMGQHGAPKKISAEQFKTLKEAGYDDLAEKLAADISDMSMGSGGSTFDPTEIRNEFQSKLTEEVTRIKAEQERKFALQMLSMRHRDWQAVRQSDDFVLWENQLPEAERIELNASEDPLFVADKFDTFKEWRSKSQEVKQSKQQRLAAAVIPTRGAPATPAAVNDDDAFLAGFTQVRGR